MNKINYINRNLVLIFIFTTLKKKTKSWSKILCMIIWRMVFDEYLEIEFIGKVVRGEPPIIKRTNIKNSHYPKIE